MERPQGQHHRHARLQQLPLGHPGRPAGRRRRGRLHRRRGRRRGRNGKGLGDDRGARPAPRLRHQQDGPRERQLRPGPRVGPRVLRPPGRPRGAADRRGKELRRRRRHRRKESLPLREGRERQDERRSRARRAGRGGRPAAQGAHRDGRRVRREAHGKVLRDGSARPRGVPGRPQEEHPPPPDLPGLRRLGPGQHRRPDAARRPHRLPAFAGRRRPRQGHDQGRGEDRSAVARRPVRGHRVQDDLRSRTRDASP